MGPSRAAGAVEWGTSQPPHGRPAGADEPRAAPPTATAARARRALRLSARRPLRHRPAPVDGVRCADFDARTGELRTELELGDDLLEQEMTTLSGGQAAKVSLAGLLLGRYDILLLDEPTNDLDLRWSRATRGVRPRPRRTDGDRVARPRVPRTDGDRGRRAGRAHPGSDHFSGGWLAYQAEREPPGGTPRRRTAPTPKRDDLTRPRPSGAGVGRQGRDPHTSPSQGTTTALRGRHDRVHGTACRAGEPHRAGPGTPRRGREALGAVAAELRDRLRGRSGDLVALLDDAVVDLGVPARAARPGGGVGRTSRHRRSERQRQDHAAARLLGQVPLTSGLHRRGSSVVVGGVEQARRQLSDARRCSMPFCAETGSTVAEARSLLAKFGLGPSEVGRPTRSLSPGERTRATLALLQARGVNCLVPDEPTNHLDLPAIEQLEAAVAAFGGTVLLVSHDRRFLGNGAARADRRAPRRSGDRRPRHLTEVRLRRLHPLHVRRGGRLDALAATDPRPWR